MEEIFMKKALKIVAILTVAVLSVAFASCTVSNKTAERRAEYAQKLDGYVSESDYTADNWAEVEKLIEEFKAKIETMAATARMDACVVEYKGKIDEVETLNDVVTAHIERLTKRIQATIDELNTYFAEEGGELACGIKKIEFNQSAKKATFYISNDQNKIRDFGDKSEIIYLFQTFFTDVDSADVHVGTAHHLYTNTELTSTNLKHLIGKYFIGLFPEVGDNYPTETLDKLIGYSAYASINVNIGGTVYNEQVTYSCEFVRA